MAPSANTRIRTLSLPSLGTELLNVCPLSDCVATRRTLSTRNGVGFIEDSPAHGNGGAAEQLARGTHWIDMSASVGSLSACPLPSSIATVSAACSLEARKNAFPEGAARSPCAPAPPSDR